MKSSSRFNPFLRNLGLVAVTAALVRVGLPQTAFAVNYTWDTNVAAGYQPGSGGTWSTSVANWSTNGTSLSNWLQTNATTALHTATFAGADGAANAYDITLGTNLAAQSLTFSNTGYRLTAAASQTLTLTNAGSGVITVASGKSATIGNNAVVNFNAASNTGTRVDLTTGGTLDIATGGTLSRTGQITSGFSATGGTLGFMGSGTINVAGTLSFNVLTPVANGGIVIAANTGNSNTLNVNGGTVSSNSTINGVSVVASGTSGSLNVNSGLVSTTGTAGVTSGINLANGTGTTGTVNLNGGTISTFRINSNYLNGSNVLTTGGTSIFNFNGGTLTAISNNSSYMAGLTRANVRDGGAKINTNGFDITIGQALEHSNVAGNNPNTGLPDNSTDGGLTKSGNGTLTLSGASTYNGATNINAGTLSLTGTLTSNLAVNNGGSLTGTGSTSGTLTTYAGSTLIGKSGSGILTASGGVNFAGTTNLVFDGALATGNTYDVVKYGSGYSNLANLFTTFRGTVNDDIGNTKLTFTAGAVGTRTWNTTSGTWQIGVAGNWAEDDTKFYNGDTVVFGDPASNSTIALSGALLPAAVSVTNTNSYTFNGTGSIGGTSTLTKSGNGDFNIATTNSYTGATTLNAGILNLSGGLKDTAISLAAAATLNVSSTGLISGAASLNTSGAVVLASANTYTGSTTINSGGSLQLGNGTTDGSVASTAISNNGSLVYNNVGSQSYAGAISGTGSLTKQGAGTLTLSASNGYQGGSSVSQGTLRIGNNSALGSGTVDIAGGATVNNSAGLSNLANTFTGSGTFTTVAGAAQVTLSGNWTGFSGTVSSATTADLVFNGGFTSGVANTTSADASYVNNYTGANTNGMIVQNVTGGAVTYKLGSYASVAGSNLRNSGTATGNVNFEIGNLNTNTVAAGTIGGGLQTTSLSKVGSGTLTLSGANTYNGTTTVSAGTLAVNGNQTGATGAVTVSNTGTRLIGTGTVGGNTTINAGAIQSAGGAVANVDKVGLQTFDQTAAATSNLTYGAGSIFEWDLNANKDTDGYDHDSDVETPNVNVGTRGVDYDGVDVTGTLSVDPGSIFRVVLGSSVTSDTFWQSTQTWTNIFGGGFTLSGTGFNNSMLEIVNPSGGTYDQSTLNPGYQFTVSGTTLTWSAVPEPTSALAGLLMASGLLRRRRK